MWMLSFAPVISAIGESFLWPLTTTYIVHVFGKSLQTVAAVLLLQHTGTLIGNVVGGVLFDRWSGRKTVITAILISIVVLQSFGTFQRFSWYLVLIFLLGLCNGTFWPSTRAFAAVLWPEGGRMGMNMLYVANNLGVAIGASVGGIVASYSFRYAFYGNAVTYLVFLLVFMVAIQESHLNKGAAVSSEQVDSVSKSIRQSNKQDRKQLRKGAKLSGDSIGRMIGPFFGGFLYDTYSPHTMLSTMIFLAILAFLFFTCYDLVRRPSVQSKQVVRHTS